MKYQYLGKSELDVEPLTTFLKDTLVPLYEDSAYRNMIHSSRSRESYQKGFPPVWLDQNWQPEKNQEIKSSRYFWCLPLQNDFFVVGGQMLNLKFPTVFGYENKSSWSIRLNTNLVKPQILISNQSSSIHVDIDRKSAVNTFLYNTDKSITEYFSGDTVTESFTYEEGDTYLIDTETPHRINQMPNCTRLVLSWGYNIPFEKAVEILNEKSKQ
jgi:hypothetical protein